MTNLAKKLNKRWGKKFVDTRNWPRYHEQLVKRGEYFLDLDWMKNWNNELEEMNRNKVGRPFEFPNSLIRLQSVWHVKNTPVRMIEGITRQLYYIAGLPDYNDYSTIDRRINRLEVKMDVPPGDTRALFSDGTGCQAINGGEFLREKYGKKNRRWVQVIILGDPVTKEPVSFEVHLVPTSEPESAERQLNALKEQGVVPNEFGGDGAFDKVPLWKYCEKNNITPIIKPDKNARIDSDSHRRNRDVKYRNKNGYEKWADKKGYGRRWPATEGIFSAIKRIFGEQLAAKTDIGLMQEAKTKVWAYKTLKRYGEA
jgi:hypothetical protein